MIHAMNTTFMFSVQYFSSFLHMWDNTTKNYNREGTSRISRRESPSREAVCPLYLNIR